jgi:hypothetical protein
MKDLIGKLIDAFRLSGFVTKSIVVQLADGWARGQSTLVDAQILTRDLLPLQRER